MEARVMCVTRKAAVVRIGRKYRWMWKDLVKGGVERDDRLDIVMVGDWIVWAKKKKPPPKKRLKS